MFGLLAGEAQKGVVVYLIAPSSRFFPDVPGFFFVHLGLGMHHVRAKQLLQ